MHTQRKNAHTKWVDSNRAFLARFSRDPLLRTPVLPDKTCRVRGPLSLRLHLKAPMRARVQARTLRKSGDLGCPVPSATGRSILLLRTAHSSFGERAREKGGGAEGQGECVRGSTPRLAGSAAGRKQRGDAGRAVELFTCVLFLVFLFEQNSPKSKYPFVGCNHPTNCTYREKLPNHKSKQPLPRVEEPN